MSTTYPNPKRGKAIPRPDNDPVHDFLIQDPEKKYDPVEVMVDLRDGIDKLPETKATFSLSRVLTDHPPSAADERMLWLVGSWRSPHTNSQVKWVNPDYPKLARFSDVVTYCECGAMMARVKEVYHESVHDDDNNHTDDCTRPMRLRARARLCEARAEAIEQTVGYGHSGVQMADRLGLKSIGKPASVLGLDIGALKEDYQTRRRNTVIILLTRHPIETVARVYGRAVKTIQGVLYKETDYSIETLRDIRRENDA